METGEAFYAAYKEGDKETYKALFGKTVDAFGAPVGENKFKNTATVGENIKVAKTRQAEKVFNKLMANDEFVKALEEADNANYRELWQWKRANADRSDYEKFNSINLLGVGGANSKVQKMFYDELKKEGFGAIADVNDRKYSGFDTKAVMIFDKSSLTNVMHTRVDSAEIGDATMKYAAKSVVKMILKSDGALDAAETYGLYTLVGGSLALAAHENEVNKEYKEKYGDEDKKKK
jgi:hypothetical protein